MDNLLIQQTDEFEQGISTRACNCNGCKGGCKGCKGTCNGCQNGCSGCSGSLFW